MTWLNYVEQFSAHPTVPLITGEMTNIKGVEVLCTIILLCNSALMELKGENGHSFWLNYGIIDIMHNISPLLKCSKRIFCITNGIYINIA